MKKEIKKKQIVELEKDKLKVIRGGYKDPYGIEWPTTKCDNAS